MSKNKNIPRWRKFLAPFLIILSSILLVVLVGQFAVNGLRKAIYKAEYGEEVQLKDLEKKDTEQKESAKDEFADESSKKDEDAITEKKNSEDIKSEDKTTSELTEESTDSEQKEDNTEAATEDASPGAEFSENDVVKMCMMISGAPQGEIEESNNGTLTIHVYETVDDGDGNSHIATWNRYTIDHNSLTGVDMLDNPVDLTKRVSEYNQRKQAAQFSTKELPKVEDFLWYRDDVAINGIPTDVPQIIGRFRTVGSWKMLLITDPEFKFDSNSWRLMNADIQITGKNVTMTLDWDTVLISDTDEVIDESSQPNSVFEGTWNDDSTVSLTGSGSIEMTMFYKIDNTEYAVGTMIWPDGVPATVVLVRTYEK